MFLNQVPSYPLFLPLIKIVVSSYSALKPSDQDQIDIVTKLKLIVTTPMPLAQTQSLNPSPTISLSSFKSTSTCSCSSSSSSYSATANNANKSSWKFSNILSNKCLMDMVWGLDATRIEYYATVGEPLYELKFVLSGLGFYDVSVGSGIEAPRGELINVRGKHKLDIPPHLPYGPEPAGCFSGDCNIPGNATLVYDINFVGIYSGNRHY
ncbi:unnamed protein product [Malus baccata var. baccata]